MKRNIVINYLKIALLAMALVGIVTTTIAQAFLHKSALYTLALTASTMTETCILVGVILLVSHWKPLEYSEEDLVSDEGKAEPGEIDFWGVLPPAAFTIIRLVALSGIYSDVQQNEFMNIGFLCVQLAMILVWYGSARLNLLIVVSCTYVMSINHSFMLGAFLTNSLPYVGMFLITACMRQMVRWASTQTA